MAKKKAKAGGRRAKTSRKKAARKTAKAKAARRRVTRKKAVRRASKVARKKATRKPARRKVVKHAAKAPRKVAARAPAARPKRPRRTTAALPPEPRPIMPPVVDVEPLAPPPITPAPYTPPAPPTPPAPAAEPTGMETDDEEGGPTASSGGPAAAGPKAGDLAPDFTLSDEQGRPHALSLYRGQKVILYFYPKDDTPGCTTEACGFRDRLGSFADRNAVVLGVSPDSVESHRRFVQKYGLNFPLLADEGHRVAEQYGVWVEKKRYGATTMGITRTTFVIDPDGRIEHVFRNVRPDGHEQEILQRLGS